jgi:prevent-host-death family protein
MAHQKVGIRDLKAQLSEYLRQVKAGETVIITEHGRPIGRIVPEPVSLEERVRNLTESGEILWDGNKIPQFDPVGDNESQMLLSDIIAELRE